MAVREPKLLGKTSTIAILLLASFSLFALVTSGRPQADKVDTLIEQLKHKNALFRGLAAGGLAEFKDARAVDALIAALKDEVSSVQGLAAAALGKIKDARAVDPLIAVLKDKDANVRIAAAWALAEFKDARAIDALIAALKDEVPFVRLAAAGALGEINSRSAAGVLTAALKGKKLEVVAGAYRFFIRRGEEGTEDVLIAALNEHGNNSTAHGFLDCGNPKLEAAAVTWAEKHGYEIPTLYRIYGQAGLRWGSGR